MSAASHASRTDRRSNGLFAIGPLGLGSLPDIDLVPEIVSQAYAAAEQDWPSSSILKAEPSEIIRFPWEPFVRLCR